MDTTTGSKYDDASGTETTGTGNTLSRVAVYASLQSFANRTDIQDNVNYCTSSSNVSSPMNTNLQQSHTNTKSSSLLSFYSDISTTYHRTAPRLDGKNTSARPLGLNDISARLSQRAITFTSKYYNNNNNSNENTTTKRKKKKSKKLNLDQVTIVSSSYNVSSAQMKRKRQNLVQRINATDSNHTDNTMMQFEQFNLKFLLELNREWNIYMKDLLQLDNVEISDTTKSAIRKQNDAFGEKTSDSINEDRNEKFLRNIHRRITTLQNNNCIEWVGAYVRIRRDKSSTTNVKWNKVIRNSDDDDDDDDVEPELQQQHHHTKRTKAKASTSTEAGTKTIEGILISHSPNSWIIVPIITAEATDINSNINRHDVDNVDDDLNIKVDNTSLRTSSIAATTGVVTAKGSVTHSSTNEAGQTQTEQKKQEATNILVLPKVKIAKQQMMNESSIMITACIPLGNCAFSFTDLYSSTNTLTNDETQFLRIHLQSR
jgi:hypothetical protein